jgi:hypothetical protein
MKTSFTAAILDFIPAELSLRVMNFLDNWSTPALNAILTVVLKLFTVAKGSAVSPLHYHKGTLVNHGALEAAACQSLVAYTATSSPASLPFSLPSKLPPISSNFRGGITLCLSVPCLARKLAKPSMYWSSSPSSSVAGSLL